MLPKLAAIKESVRDAWTFSQPPEANTRITDTVVVGQPKISRQAGQGTSKEDKSPEHSLGATAMWMLSSSEPRSIPFFGNIHDLLVWACIAPLFVMSFVPLRQWLFFAATIVTSSSCGSVQPASLVSAFLLEKLRRHHATFFCPRAPVLMSSISLNTFAPFFFKAITVPFAQHGRLCTVRSLHHQFNAHTLLPWFAQDTCFQ